MSTKEEVTFRPPTLGDEQMLADQQIDLEANNPWGIPNWEVANDYPSIEETDDCQWRWEFIRRHPSYRRYWIAYQDDRSAWDRYRADGNTRNRVAGKVFGFSQLFSPACYYTNYICRQMQNTRPFNIWMLQCRPRTFAIEAIKKGHVLISVDPTVALDRLWPEIQKAIDEFVSDDAAAIAQERKLQSPSRMERRLFRDHLRILDAINTMKCKPAIMWKKICDVFDLNDAKTAERRLEGARKTQAKFVHLKPINDPNVGPPFSPLDNGFEKSVAQQVRKRFR